VNAQKLAAKYIDSAKMVNPTFTPSFVAGKQFYNRKFNTNGHEVACASCHTQNPANTGKNIVTSKPIKPLSPVVNPNRFTDIAKVEDNFIDHCNDIIGADCSAEEKANFITYLLTADDSTD
jgi:mono/diheme cytochrome c family protein